MQPGDEKVVADRLYALLSRPPRIAPPPAPEGPAISVAGQWDMHLDFGYGTAHHKLMFEQDGAKLAGSHEGEFAAGDLSGTVAANSVRFQSSLATEGTRVSFHFSGTLEGNQLSGTVALGEYGEARWTATRHQYSTGRRG
jgi:L-seryl-tRNA(Ser) seleniumtransferase